MKKFDSHRIKIFVLGLFITELLVVSNIFAQDSSESQSAKIVISIFEKDSSRQVIAHLTSADTAVKGIDIHFYIKKSFGLLPIEGDNTTTDENGEATVDFPADIPGDVSGNLTVIARVEEDENLGSIEAAKKVKWGVPMKTEQPIKIRALWSSGNNAPWALVIVVTALVAGVWSVIVYIFYQLVIIKRAGKRLSV
jgi:hypothetical protein